MSDWRIDLVTSDYTKIVIIVFAVFVYVIYQLLGKHRKKYSAIIISAIIIIIGVWANFKAERNFRESTLFCETTPSSDHYQSRLQPRSHNARRFFDYDAALIIWGRNIPNTSDRTSTELPSFSSVYGGPYLEREFWTFNQEEETWQYTNFLMSRFGNYYRVLEYIPNQGYDFFSSCLDTTSFSQNTFCARDPTLNLHYKLTEIGTYDPINDVINITDPIRGAGALRCKRNE